MNNKLGEGVSDVLVHQTTLVITIAGEPFSVVNFAVLESFYVSDSRWAFRFTEKKLVSEGTVGQLSAFRQNKVEGVSGHLFADRFKLGFEFRAEVVLGVGELSADRSVLSLKSEAEAIVFGCGKLCLLEN